MSVVRILFLGTPEFAVPSLKALHEDEHFEIVGVVSQPDRPAGRKRRLTPSPVKLAAQEKDLAIFTPEKIKEPTVIEELANLKADAAVVVAFGQLLPQAFLDLFPLGVVNVHSSLLPRWRGAAPMQRALMAGDKISGVSLQKVVLKLDAGDVLGERRVELGDSMNAVELHDVLKEKACELLTIEFMDHIRGNLAGTPQDESLVTHAAKIQVEEGVIDWAQPAEKINNQIRGMALGPKTWCFRDDKKLKVLRAEVVDCSGEPGTIVAVDKVSFTIASGELALKVTEVQPESKPAMATSEYLKGYPLKVGDRLS